MTMKTAAYSKNPSKSNMSKSTSSNVNISKRKSMITFNQNSLIAANAYSHATTVTVTPNSSSDNLHQQLVNVLSSQQPAQRLSEQQQQQVAPKVTAQTAHQEQQRDPSPRPLKKRKFSVSSSSSSMVDDNDGSTAPAAVAPITIVAPLMTREEEQANNNRKVLAAKLRANNISQRVMIRPSDYARTVFMKNTGLHPQQICDEYSTKKSSQKQPISISQQNIDIAIEIHQKHSPELYAFVRKGDDLDGFKACVRRLYNQYYSSSSQESQEQKQEKQIQFRCCNKFGESLMHLACRRGRTDMVRFLLEEDLSLSVDKQCSNENNENIIIEGKRERARHILLSIHDDYNKTPFHDACWTPTPNFELVLLLLKYVPEQILIQDIRGNTPFDYVRRNDYPLWLKFIWSNKNMFNNLSC
jgi:hypothetical protein